MPNTNSVFPEKPIGGRRQAMVTGASSGLGAEFARQLAAKGLDLMITARREERLQALARELRERYGVDVIVIPGDLTVEDDVRRLENHLRQSQRLDLLVNNAGFGFYGRFWEADQGVQDDMVLVHVRASMRLSRAVLPGMLAQHRGGIIQVSSLAAFAPGGNNVMYKATKAFLVAFSQALQVDLKGSGVHVQALCPGFTITEYHEGDNAASFDRNRVPKWLWLDARDVIAKSLVDIERGSGVVVVGFWYKLAAALLRTRLVSGIAQKIAAG